MLERINGLKKVQKIMLEIYSSDIYDQDLRDAALEATETIGRRIAKLEIGSGGEKILGGEYHE